ncbi:MAG TPA: hypothetical protein VNP03_28265, partial [Pseudonocardia sp.]|nr:hypothetical protein [Pseudonocardia sp.]
MPEPAPLDSVPALLASLRSAGVGRGDPVAVALVPGRGLGLAAAGAAWTLLDPEPARVVAAVEEGLRPRWVWWSQDTPAVLAAARVRLATCWDLAA